MRDGSKSRARRRAEQDATTAAAKKAVRGEAEERDQKTAELKEQRLAKEAAEVTTPKPPKLRARSRKTEE